MELEKRTYSTPIERAKGENSRKVSGYAAVFGSPSEPLGGSGFTEVIATGAFDNADMTDVRALLNHDQNLVYARTKSGTLELTVDKRGLRYEFEAPDSPAGDNLIASLDRGDIDQSSFAFFVSGEKWEEFPDGSVKRTITDIERVQDVSPVTFPAYEATTAVRRNLENLQKDKTQKFVKISALDLAKAKLTILKK